MTLRSDPKQIRRVEAFLKRVNRSAHLDEIQMHKMMVSVTEAVNNAIIHGNKSDETKKVQVRCEVMSDYLVVVVADEGRGFQPGKVRNPLERKNLMRENGRGVFLMRTLMDRVDFEVGPGGSEVALRLERNK
jgi:serine/threonine-protein kinase RsbW